MAAHAASMSMLCVEEANTTLGLFVVQTADGDSALIAARVKTGQVQYISALVEYALTPTLTPTLTLTLTPTLTLTRNLVLTPTLTSLLMCVGASASVLHLVLMQCNYAMPAGKYILPAPSRRYPYCSDCTADAWGWMCSQTALQGA